MDKSGANKARIDTILYSALDEIFETEPILKRRLGFVATRTAYIKNDDYSVSVTRL